MGAATKYHVNSCMSVQCGACTACTLGWLPTGSVQEAALLTPDGEKLRDQDVDVQRCDSRVHSP